MTVTPTPTAPTASAGMRIARLLTFVLLALGVAAAIAGAVWIQLARGTMPSDAEVYAMSITRRGFWLLAHGELGAFAVPALFVAALAGGVLFWVARTASWPFAVVAVSAGLAVVAVWMLRDGVIGLEPPAYRRFSPYVAAATDVAYAGTVYFASLAAAAAAAFFLTRRKSDVRAQAVPAP